MPYTVKQVSALTGIAPDRLRAWERRYGVVTPTRTDSGYRLYDDADVARLRLMMRLVDAGTPASLAAQQVTGTAPVQDTRDRAVEPLGASAAPDPDTLVRVARSLDRAEAEHLLDQAFAAGSFESVVEQWLLPALATLGEAWADGLVDVAGEHFVSAAVRRRLGRAFDAAGTALGGPVVLAGLPPGALHELGSLSFATVLRRLGADVRWLGVDLPVDSWAHAAGRLHHAGAVVSVPLEGDAPAAAAVVRQLSQEAPATRVYVGGLGASAVPGLLESGTDDSMILLPGSVVEAARAIATDLRGV